MGGAVSIGVAAHPAVTGVLGLAPWIPERLSLEGLRGKRLDVLHGSWDRYLPGIPGVSAASSRRGFERARALGIEGTYTLIPRGLHGAALRRRSGAILRLPRARRLGRRGRQRADALQAEIVSGSRRAGGARADVSLGRRTFQARPSFSSVRIVIHAMSSWRRSRPCRAEAGNAWWLLCHPSPKVSAATTQLLRLSSRER